MFIVLYRRRIKPQMERHFIESWSAVTTFFCKNHHSLGSRLHLGNDGLCYGYAQWNSAEHRENAFAGNLLEINGALADMSESIEENFPDIILDLTADYLV